MSRTGKIQYPVPDFGNMDACFPRKPVQHRKQPASARSRPSRAVAVPAGTIVQLAAPKASPGGGELGDLCHGLGNACGRSPRGHHSPRGHPDAAATFFIKQSRVVLTQPMVTSGHSLGLRRCRRGSFQSTTGAGCRRCMAELARRCTCLSVAGAWCLVVHRRHHAPATLMQVQFSGDA